MPKTIIQIYEIQTPDQAGDMIALGVDHIGSVLLSADDRPDPVLKETISVVRRKGAVSCLIPLFREPDAVVDALACYRPHIVHFCDRLDESEADSLHAAMALQEAVKRRFPGVRIMRSIPIGQPPQANRETVLMLAERLEPLSDLFLTDTVITHEPGIQSDDDQPVAGFVGITGLTCDWSVAAQLAARSRIPVILAGGISPENVVEAIRRVRPFGVDSCTCTNAVDAAGRPMRFRKDPTRVGALVAETRRADRLFRQG